MMRVMEGGLSYELVPLTTMEIANFHKRQNETYPNDDAHEDQNRVTPKNQKCCMMGSANSERYNQSNEYKTDD